MSTSPYAPDVQQHFSDKGSVDLFWHSLHTTLETEVEAVLANYDETVEPGTIHALAHDHRITRIMGRLAVRLSAIERELAASSQSLLRRTCGDIESTRHRLGDVREKIEQLAVANGAPRASRSAVAFRLERLHERMLAA